MRKKLVYLIVLSFNDRYSGKNRIFAAFLRNTVISHILKYAG